MDRNVDPDKDTLTDDVSLSARRAWIEMLVSVFTNFCSASLSARRAWIEIRMELYLALPTMVALRKESVDRNDDISDDEHNRFSRSPQGERG